MAVVTKCSPDIIVTRRPIDKEKIKYQPVTTKFLTNAKLPASLLSSSAPRKK